MEMPGIGPILTEWRKKLGLTAPAFAARVGRHTTTVCRYEAGERGIDLNELDAWQEKLADPRYRTFDIVQDYLSRRYPNFKA